MGSLLDVWLCTTQRHEPWLLALVVGICLVAAAGGMRLYAHALQAPRETRRLWMAAAGVTTGAGVWMTHFAATIGFHHIGSAGAYDPVLTLASLGVATVGFSLAFALAGQGERRARAAAGLSLGLVIAGLHYVGVRGMAVFGLMSFDPALAAVSVALGSLGGCAALLVVGDGRNKRRALAAAVILALGVAGLHFTGMTALDITSGPSSVWIGRAVDAGALSGFMAVVAGVVLASICGAALFATRVRNHALESLRAALDAMPAGVAVFDAESRLVICNEQYDRLSAEPPGVAPRADHDEERFHEGVWTRRQDRSMPGAGTVSVITDVTPLKLAVQALAEARDRAEAANEAKTEFLANMSHELRTPLNGVVALASVLAGAGLPAPLREMADVIVTSSMSLDRLLSDVLDLARVETGRLTIQPEVTDLRVLLDRIASLHAVAAGAKGLAFAWAPDPETAMVLRCDPLRVEQVLNNLLSNAVKFTEAGGVELRARREEGDLTIEVADTGIGFDQSRAEALFGRFEQADGSVTRRFGGSGLGLAISRELAGLMGARLSAVSTPGRGSCFTLRLPPDAGSSPALLAEAA
jgi:signal transduction histidine kinase